MRRRRPWSDTSGATALEFAMISPLLFFLLFGGVQLAWAMHCAASVRWSLETNARQLMLTPTESAATLKSAMMSALSGKTNVNDLTVTIARDNSGATPMLVATSIYRTTLSVPFMASKPLTFTSVTSVPAQ